MTKSCSKRAWRKGGRSIASNGYVLIKVGKLHHLAYSNGYALEHRLVAESELGRRLLPQEIVHHRDGNRQNNSPQNLEVISDRSSHASFHLKQQWAERRLNKPNPIIACECGCGTEFYQRDSRGRVRRYVVGHFNPHPKRTEALSDELGEIIKETWD